MESQQTSLLSRPTERARASLIGLNARSVAGLRENKVIQKLKIFLTMAKTCNEVPG